MSRDISKSDMMCIDINKALEFIRYDPSIDYRDTLEQQVQATVCSFKEVTNFNIDRTHNAPNQGDASEFTWNYTFDDNKFGTKIIWKKNES
jgi:hypothetical protein